MKLSQIPTINLDTHDIVQFGALVFLQDTDQPDKPILCQHAIIVEKSKYTDTMHGRAVNPEDAIKCIIVIPNCHDNTSGCLPIFKISNTGLGSGGCDFKMIH